MKDAIMQVFKWLFFSQEKARGHVLPFILLVFWQNLQKFAELYSLWQNFGFLVVFYISAGK